MYETVSEIKVWLPGILCGTYLLAVDDVMLTKILCIQFGLIQNNLILPVELSV